MKQLFRNKTTRIVNAVKKLLNQGLTPPKIALCIVLGSCIAIIPIVGVNTMLLTVLAIILRLNLPLIQAINLGLWPVQIALLAPFFKLGESFFNHAYIPFSVKQLYLSFKADWAGTLVDFWHANLQALGAWVIISLPLSIVLYYLLIMFIKRLKPVELDYNLST
jgi:uncharacterized protein (DUF2062 family)